MILNALWTAEIFATLAALRDEERGEYDTKGFC